MRTILLFSSACFFAQIMVAQGQPSTPVRTTLSPAKPATQPKTTTVQPKQSGERAATTQGKTAHTQTQPAKTQPSPYPAPATQPATATTAPRNAETAPAAAKPLPTTASPAAKNATADSAKPLKVKWMSIEEALAKSKVEKRKIIIDVFTEWCGWCKRMDETTFADPKVVAYLNEHFYPVKFDAEQKQDIAFRDKVYKFKKEGGRGFHELAAEWLQNRLSFPTTVFLNEDLELIQPLPGYLDAPKFETVINYFGSDSHKKTPWETYEKNFGGHR